MSQQKEREKTKDVFLHSPRVSEALFQIFLALASTTQKGLWWAWGVGRNQSSGAGWGLSSSKAPHRREVKPLGQEQ